MAEGEYREKNQASKRNKIDRRRKPINFSQWQVQTRDVRGASCAEPTWSIRPTQSTEVQDSIFPDNPDTIAELNPESDDLADELDLEL